MYFSKSKYCEFCQCGKISWLKRYKPEEESEPDEFAKARYKQGERLGALARGYFGDFVEMTAYNGDKPDLAKMIEETKAEIEKNTPVICEAAFDFGGLYCAVDILHREGNGWSKALPMMTRTFICWILLIRNMSLNTAG